MGTIIIKNVKKEFNDKIALQDINLSVKEKECVSLLGKNGAGKSTLLNIILGNYSQNAGSVDIKFNKEEIGILPQKTNFPDDIKVTELVQFVSSYSSNSLSFEEVNAILQFSDYQLNQFASKLSGGQQRLLDFCLSIINNPKLLIMDEPTSGMDTSTRKHFWDIIEKLKLRETTIVFTTHYIEEVNYCSDRVILLDEGEIIADDTPYHLRLLKQRKIIWIEKELYKKHQDMLETMIKKNDIVLKENNSLIALQFLSEKTTNIISELSKNKFPLDKIELTNTSLLNVIFDGVNTVRGEE